MGAFAILAIVATIIFIIIMSVMIYIDLFRVSKKKEQIEVINTDESASVELSESQQGDTEDDNPQLINEEDYTLSSPQANRESPKDASLQAGGSDASKKSPKVSDSIQTLASEAANTVEIKNQLDLTGIEESLLYESGILEYKPKIKHYREIC